jgi:hypothetical protein
MQKDASDLLEILRVPQIPQQEGISQPDNRDMTDASDVTKGCKIGLRRNSESIR